MLERWANIKGKLRKVYVIRTSRQADLFGEVKFVHTVSTSKLGSNPMEIEPKNLLKEKPPVARRRKERQA